MQLLSVEEALLSLYRDIIPIPLWFRITAMLYASGYYYICVLILLYEGV